MSNWVPHSVWDTKATKCGQKNVEETNETQRERRLSKDLNDEQKRAKKNKNGKNDPGSKKTYKKKTQNTKTQKGLTVRQTERECMLERDREREREMGGSTPEESLLGPSEKSKRDTNTRNRLRMGRAVLPLAASQRAQGNWIEFPVGRSNSVACLCCLFQGVKKK